MGKLQIGPNNGPVAVLKSTMVLQNRYEITHRDGQSISIADDSIQQVKELGAGGFGVVVRARDELRIPRAIKFFELREISFAGETSTYKREIGLTNATPFKGVIRIMDHGEAKDSRGASYGMYVMDFVHGVSLKKFFLESIVAHSDEILKSPIRRARTYDLTFSLLDQLVSSIAELHEINVAHMDIKPQNILVHTGYTAYDEPKAATSDTYKLWLTDLGAGKKIRAENTGRTKLISTERYFPRYLLDRDDLDFDSTDYSISQDKLRSAWQRIDLHCLGRTLEELFLDTFRCLQNTPLFRFVDAGTRTESQEKAKEDFWRSILGQEFDVLKSIIEDLVNQRSPIEDILTLKELLAKIPRSAPANVRSSVLLTDPYPGVHIRVSNDLIDIALPLKPIIDHPVFQRLKSLSQLALISEAFPGATHTRFAHSLLTFNLAKRFVYALSRDARFRYLFRRKDIDTVLCGALLHDLGQYPFAHSLEDLRKAPNSAEKEDQLGRQLLYDHQLFGRMASIPDSDGKTIGEYLSNIDVDVDEVAQLVSKESFRSLPPSKRKDCMSIGREIINGTIDVDRISYLRYDSLMTGVPYGKGIDLDGLLKNLVVRHDPPFDVGLAINEEGVNAAEMVLAAVYWMYRNVYWHRTNRLSMAILKNTVYHLMAASALSFDEYIDETTYSGDRGALGLLQTRSLDTFGANVANPLGELLLGHRLKYHAIVEFGHRGLKENLWEWLVANATRKKIEALTRAVAELLGYNLKPGDPGILWDVPLKPRLPAARNDRSQFEGVTRAEAAAGVRLWVKVPGASAYGAEWVHITEYSALAAAVTTEEDRQGRKIRLFVSDEIFSRSTFSSKGRSALEAAVIQLLKSKKKLEEENHGIDTGVTDQSPSTGTSSS